VPVPMFFYYFKGKFDNLFKIAVIILKSIYKQLAVMFLVTRKIKYIKNEIIDNYYFNSENYLIFVIIFLYNYKIVLLSF